MSTLQQKLNTFFYQPFPKWAWLLSPAEWGYALAGYSRRKGYERQWLKKTSVSTPVISIGNLTTGGTGKTPIVLALGKHLIEKGLKVIILTRGYGATEPIEYDRPTSPDHGDEAYYLQQALPDATVIVGKDRKLNAVWAEKEFEPDVILLDDGFQYIGLERHLNIFIGAR